MSIVENLQHIQAQLKAPKNQRNTFGNYNYRSLEDITEAVKPLLQELGAVLLFSDEIVQIGERYYVKTTATLKTKDEAISITAFARETLARKGMDESQITGATSSYARKYAANGLFAIDDTKDADANNTQQDKQKPPASKAKKEPPKQAKPMTKTMEIIDQAFFNFQTENKDVLAEGFAYDKDKFTKAIVKHFKKLPTNEASIRKICDIVKPEEVTVEIPAT